MSELTDELKTLIVESLELEDVEPNDIDTDAPLFRDGLGLDSIDALELGVAINKRYGITLGATSEKTREHFFSVRSLADFISANQ